LSKAKIISWLKKSGIWIIPVFSVLVFAVYANTFDSPFLFDDEVNILENRYLRIPDLSWKSIAGIYDCPRHNLRFVSLFTFALNYYFHRYDVTGYHLVNILVHLLTGILLFYFIRMTLKLFYQQPDKSPPGISLDLIAFLASALWLVNPLDIFSVTYIVQRMNSLTAAFYLLSLILYIKGRIARQQ